MPTGSTQPDWVPPGGGADFATRVVAGTPVSARPPEPAKGPKRIDVSVLARQILAGERAALARGITLVESRASAHRVSAEALLELLTPQSGQAQRIGITGVPGAGKSTFIEMLGMRLCEAGRRVAVLSVDPSSPVSGGSILGDKTRMEKLSRHPAAFIRPSPSGCELGGVARRTRESITLCEAAGFDLVLVETVGVGQSEVMVREMVDCFLVLMIAGAGDELQGIKKGILELADLLAVNKADGENRVKAEMAKLEYARALHYLASEPGVWVPPVLACSSVTGEGLDELWAAVQNYFVEGKKTGSIAHRRQQQSLAWLHSLVLEGLQANFLANAAVRAEQAAVETLVVAGQVSPAVAARRLLARALQSVGSATRH